MVKPVRIHVRLESENLNLPELRRFIGKRVVIEVSEQPLDTKPFDYDAVVGTWPDKQDDGFDEALREWREADAPRLRHS
jgi:hypothetical protein